MRILVAGLFVVVLVLIPLGVRSKSSPASATVGSASSQDLFNIRLAQAQQRLAHITSTTQAPTTTTTVRVTVPHVVHVAVTVPRPTTTTTRAPGNVLTGQASWWNPGSGKCAMNKPPLGTKVTVTNLANGKTTTCVVSDRGPNVSGRIIDLDETQFRQIADPSQGVITVRVSW